VSATVLAQVIVGAAVLGGAALLWKAVAGWTTRVRFRREGESLVIAWHRWGRLVSTQLVPHSSVERVFVEEHRGGRSNSYRLVITTASGPITFESVGFGERADYEKQAAELSDFLELGAAPTGGVRVADAGSNGEGGSRDESREDDRAARSKNA
jgi:hypothetical protein